MLGAGDTVLLFGDLGAGKSTFARALIRTHLLDKNEPIPSPTYTLMQTYQGRDFALCHADLYRLSEARELEELGLFEIFDDALCLVEWPELLGERAPKSALRIHFEIVSEFERIAHFDFAEPRWTDVLKMLSDEMKCKEAITA